MNICYTLKNYWSVSRVAHTLSPRVAARYLQPRIVWAQDEWERALLERLRDEVVFGERHYREPSVVALGCRSVEGKG